MTPSLCGGLMRDKRSVVAFTWTLTTICTFVAIIVASAMMIQVDARYRRLEHYYMQKYGYENNYYGGNRRYLNDNREREGENNNNNQRGQGQEGNKGGAWEEQQGHLDQQIQEYLLLASMSSNSMTFVAIYTMLIALVLNIYGTTAIVGFTSLRGVYIAPCFSASGSPKLRMGVFGGAIIFFANLLLMCAVFFGEVRVEDWKDAQAEENRDMETYEVERIATVLAVTAMFLAALYTIFAVLLYLYISGEENLDDLEDPTGAVNKPLPSITNDPRRENFITMGDTL